MWPRARGAAWVGWVAQAEKAQASLRRQGRGRRVQAEKAQASQAEKAQASQAEKAQAPLRRQGRGRKVQARELEWGPRAGERRDQR